MGNRTQGEAPTDSSGSPYGSSLGNSKIRRHLLIERPRAQKSLKGMRHLAMILGACHSHFRPGVELNSPERVAKNKKGADPCIFSVTSKRPNVTARNASETEALILQRSQTRRRIQTSQLEDAEH